VVCWVCCSLACALDPEMLRRGAKVAWRQGRGEEEQNRSSERIRIKTIAIGNGKVKTVNGVEAAGGRCAWHA
jgi:ribosomal protein L32E